MGLRGRHRRASSSAGRRSPPGKGGSHAQGLGRSRGGLSSKIHRACELIDGLACGHVIADRADDAEHFHDTVLEAEATPVIPPWPNRRRPHAYDRHHCKERNLIERCFAELKPFRRVATRYDKLLIDFLGTVTMAAIVIRLA